MEFKNFNSSVGSQSSSSKRPEETSPAGNKFSNFHKTFNVETVVKQEKKPVEKVTTPTQQNELPQGRTFDLSIDKPSVFDKAKSFVGKISSSIGSWYENYQNKVDETQFRTSELMKGKATYVVDPVTKKKTLTTENIERYKSAQTPEDKYKILDESVQSVPIMKFLNSTAGKKVTGAVQQYTSDIPLKTWARIKSIGDDTYDEAKSALLAKKEDPNNNRFERIMFGLQDSGVQSGIGALLSVGTAYLTRNPRVGQAVSLAYFAPISAESQRKDKGQVESLTNIAIDTIGDSIISGFAESALKNVIKEGGEVALKEFVKSIGKGFLVEGITEPAQTFLKYANDYKEARTTEDKKKVVAQVVNYVKSGAMVDEFLIGGISGAGITAVATGAGTIAGKDVDVEPSLQPKEPVVGQINDDFVTVRDEVDTLRQDIAQDPDNTQLTERLVILQDQLEDYQQAVKKRPIYVTDENSDAPIAMIETAQYQDGKFASRIIANTPNSGAQTNFLDSPLYNTEEEAITGAKKELNEWVEATKKDTSDPAEIEVLNNIVKGMTQPEVIGNVPIEVKAGKEEGALSVPVSEVESGLGEEINNDNPKIVSLVESIKSGKNVPPVPVYIENGKYILNKDGAHRLRAFKLAGVETIPVKVEEKTTKTSTQKQTEERAKNEPSLSKGYTRYTITLDNGEKVYADFDMGKGIGEKGGASHVEFQSIIKGKPNSISDTGYKSLFSQYNPEGLSEEQIIEDITDVANRLVEEETATQSKKKKILPSSKKKEKPEVRFSKELGVYVAGINKPNNKVEILGTFETEDEANAYVKEMTGVVLKETKKVLPSSKKKSVALKKESMELSIKPSQKPLEEAKQAFGEDNKIPFSKTVKGEVQLKPLVNATDIKTILANSKDFKENPVLVVDNEKNLVFSGKTDTFKIKATAMGLNEDNLGEGDKIEVDVEALKAKGAEKQLRVFKGGSVLASFKSPQGQKTLTKIMERPSDEGAREVQTVPEGFKVSERAKNILKEFGVVSGERSLSNKYLGVYKPLSKKIRVQAFYDVTTVTHEAVHAIDDQIGFAQRIIDDPKGRKRNGTRKQLTQIYTKLYPGGKENHKLELRIKEGLAVLFENYFYDPVNTARAYPDLVEKFIKPTGEYYDPLFAKLLDRMNSLVKDYAQLSPEEKIYSRVRTGKEVVQQEKGFTASQRFIYEIFNRFEPLKRYAKMAGVSETWEDPVIQAFNILNKNSIIFNWVKGKETPILMRDGNFKVEKGTVADYLALTKGSEKEFRSYLIARRVFESHNNVTALKNARDMEVEMAKPSQTAIEVLMETRPELDQEQAFLLAKAALREKIYAKYDEQITKIENVIKKDDFSVHDAEAVVAKFGRKFKEAETIYDNINKRLITLSEENGLIDKETADTYRAEKGYASFRRFIDEELDSVGTITSSSKSKVSSFKERTGSQLDIVDPIYSQILAINEIMGKAMENRLWQKVDGLAKINPEISQRFEKIEPVIAIDGQGKISYPQEKDPGVIRIWVDGKRQFRKAAPEFISVQKSLRGKENDTFVQILRIPSSVFTRLTTSANPFFAVGNLAVDQISATTQSKKGFKPILDPARGLVDYIKSDEAMRAYYAIGGKRQTLSAYFDLSPDDVVHRLTGGETKVEKVSGFIDSKLGILEMPSNLSEILTRFSEYKRALKSGEPMSVAMYRASEVSTPFQLQGNFGGRLGQEYIKSIPYLNAIIQVLYKYGRTVKSNPQRVLTMSASLLTVALTTAILVMRDASDEQKRLLSEQPARNMSRYLYFPSPNGKGLIKMRIPEQMGVFTGLAYLYVIENYGGNKVSFDNYVDLITSTVPEQINILDPKKMVLSYIPQVLKPSVMVASNTKTYPDVAPIVPQFVVDRKPSEQYNAYTSKVAKTLGQLTNTSPMLIDYWVKNQFGVVGGLLVGKVPSDPVNIQEKDYVMSGRSYNKFYDDRTIVQQQYSIIKEDPKNYSPEEISEIKQKQKVYTEMSDVLSSMRKINNTMDLPEDVRKMAYDVLLNIDTRSYSENVKMIVPLKNKIDVIRYTNKIK